MTGNKPSAPFILASWAALLVGVLTFSAGLINASMELSSKGFYFVTLMFGLFGAISVQKIVRDQLEDVPVTNIYYGLSWVATLLPILLLMIGLWNAQYLMLNEKGFFAISFVLSIFAVIVVQKNVRDLEAVTNRDSGGKEV